MGQLFKEFDDFIGTPVAQVTDATLDVPADVISVIGSGAAPTPENTGWVGAIADNVVVPVASFTISPLFTVLGGGNAVSGADTAASFSMDFLDDPAGTVGSTVGNTLGDLIKGLLKSPVIAIGLVFVAVLLVLSVVNEGEVAQAVKD